MKKAELTQRRCFYSIPQSYSVNGKNQFNFNPHEEYWRKGINLHTVLVSCMKAQRRGNCCPEMWDQISQRYCNMHREKKDCPALIHSRRLLISHFTISMAPWWKIKPQQAVFSFPKWKRSENLCCIEQLKNCIYSHRKICWLWKASFCWFSTSFWPSICTEKNARKTSTC